MCTRAVLFARGHHYLETSEQMVHTENCGQHQERGTKFSSSNNARN